jgi:hypothetical protein
MSFEVPPAVAARLREAREALCEVCDKPGDLDVVRGVIGHRSCFPQQWIKERRSSAAFIRSRHGRRGS